MRPCAVGSARAAGLLLLISSGCAEEANSVPAAEDTPGIDLGPPSTDRPDGGQASRDFGAGPAETFDAPFLWAPLRLDRGPSLGARVELALNAQPPGPVQLRELGLEAGLAQAVGGGNQHGVGIGFVDVNGDGFDDIYVANGLGFERYASTLWLNQGDGRFANITQASGIGRVVGDMDTYSVAAADYDADGDLDLYVGAHPRDLLLQNDGAGRFVDVAEAVGAGGPLSSEFLSRRGVSKIASWGDWDGDGWMDVVVASSAFENLPRRAYLLRNLGDGRFEDVSEAAGVFAAPTGNPCAVMWSDYDNDGDQDLWIWNDRGSSTANRVLLRNDGGRFTDVTVEAGLTQDIGNPMGIDAADIDQNGRLDYFISDIGGTPLFLGQEDGSFLEVSREVGASGDYGWGLGFEDFDANGWWDMFVAQEDNRDYLTFTHEGGVPVRFIQAGWPHVEVFRTGAHNVAVAFADYDRDGRVDVVTATTDGSRINLFRNETDLGGQHWLHVRVGRTPGTGARGGVSARIVVKTGDRLQFKDINGGSSRASQNATGVRFGLGAWNGAEWVAALWPDGRQLVVRDVPGDQTLVLE
ncbi:MAG: CRTAC1 family protein [Myxococcota bacterium]